jgi:hypothetical protein
LSHIEISFLMIADVEVTYRPGAGPAKKSSTLAEVSAAEFKFPVRLPASYRGQRNYPGLFWLATTESTQPYESLLERDRLWLADFDPDVVRVVSQPAQFVAHIDGRTHRHVPDFLLGFRDGTFRIVDVKAPQFLGEQRVRVQLAWTARLCREKGWLYEVWSGGDPVVLTNIRFLAIGRRRGLIDPDYVNSVAYFAASGMTLGAVEDAAESALGYSTRLASMALLWWGRWSTDLTIPLSRSSILRCKEEP